MWPLFSLNPLSKKNIGTILLGSCLFSSSFAQTLAPATPAAVPAPKSNALTPVPENAIQTPSSVEYPGIIQTFEKIIQVDADKFNNRSKDLVKNGRTFTTSQSVSGLDLEPDFLNSIILHSDSSYIKLASMDKCRFYDAIITDLLKSAEGKIQNVLVTYLDGKGKRQSSIMARKDFLSNVVNLDCPLTKKLIDQFQLKNLDRTLKEVSFDIPGGREQCQTVHLNWLGSPKTPYLCQIYEYLDQAKKGQGDPSDLVQRKAVAGVIDKKFTPMQKDYLENICKHLDDEDLFCAEFLNVSMWTKIAGGIEDRIYAQGICSFVAGTNEPSDAQLRQCLARMKKETDLCLYQSSKNRGLSPQMNCESLSLALNYSTMRSDYMDCPSHSDQLGVTNLSRILLNITKGSVKEFQGPCSNISTGEVLDFNEKFDNDESWKLQACYDDTLNEKEVCSKVFFGSYHNSPYSFPSVVAQALKQMRGAEQGTTCKMIDSRDYSPLKMEFKSGCVIIYEANKCFVSQCKHKILYNDRPIDFIKIKNHVTLDYFPTSVQGERFSQQYLLTHDFKRTGKALSNLTNVLGFFKKSRNGFIHGTGCMEELLPTFMKSQSFGQCTPVPFIIDGIIRDNDSVALVTRTALDPLQAPRLVSWSNVFSAVRTYQRYHPLRLWTLYGLD